jgi:hypothetical protein
MADSGDGVVANGQRLLARSIILPFASAPAPSLGYPLWILILCTLGALVLQITVLDRVAVQVERSTP